jgi:hypothetical protein
LKLAPDEGFDERRKMFAERCRKREGRKGVRDEACSRAGCGGR